MAIDKKELHRIAKCLADVEVSLHQVIHAGMWYDNDFAFWVRDWIDARIDKQIEEAFMSIMAGDCSAENAWRMEAGE